MFVKISGSKRVPHSKRSYSRHIFCNQLMFYVSDTTLSNDKYRSKNSRSITVCNPIHIRDSQICAFLFCKLVDPQERTNYYYYYKQRLLIFCNASSFVFPLVICSTYLFQFHSQSGYDHEGFAVCNSA